MLDKLKESLRRFLIGRHGQNIMTRDFFIISTIFFILAAFTKKSFFFTLGLTLMLYSYFRIFSKNVFNRRQERNKYIKLRNKILSPFKFIKKVYNERNESKFFICKSCGTKLRVPKGKGNIKIKCPKCGNEFNKKT